MFKRILFVIIFIISLAITGFAKEKVFDHGVNVIQTGVGFGLHGLYHDTAIPPLHVGYERGVVFHKYAPISFGGIVGYARSEYDHPQDDLEYTWDYLFFGFRCAYHFTGLFYVDGMDVYAGIILGWTIVIYNSEPDNAPSQKHNNYFLGGVYGGIRYYFTDFFGVFAELGYGIGYISGGVCFRF